MEDLNDAVTWLDTHFTVTEDQLRALTTAVLGRQMSRMDSLALRDLSGVRGTGAPGSNVHKAC